ncbi:hypothetical protein, partial [Mesorhizobium sp. M6A.T.Ce.TU.002.03.1.1]|uniref:hypothetical protein n=1 Tax=Mesorhizobium sp. M6A.T.Ce.TU.002.03.1.1 TaxID=2496782 RepID=UPI0019CFA5CF
LKRWGIRFSELNRIPHLFREAAAFHVLVLSMGQNELQTGLDQRGKVNSNLRWRKLPVAGHNAPTGALAVIALITGAPTGSSPAI